MHNRQYHPLQLYVAGKSKPEQSNDRLVLLSWKGNKTTGREAHAARCFSVPVFQPQLSGKHEPFLDMLVDAFEEMQKRIVHKYVTDLLDAGEVPLEVPASLCDEDAVLSYFNSQEAGEDSSRGKLSATQIGGWFNDKLKDVVIAKLAENNGWLESSYQMTKEEEKKLEQAAASYRATLEKLAAPQPKVSIDTAKTLKRAVELLPMEMRSGDVVASKLMKKLDVLITPPVEKVPMLEML